MYAEEVSSFDGYEFGQAGVQSPRMWRHGDPLEPLMGSQWDETNCMLRAEWRALSARLTERERERQRAYTQRQKLAIFNAFRQRLLDVYGANEVADDWREWQSELDKAYPERSKRPKCPAAR